MTDKTLRGRVQDLADRMQDYADTALNPDNREYLGAFAKALRALLEETPRD